MHIYHFRSYLCLLWPRYGTRSLHALLSLCQVFYLTLTMYRHNSAYLTNARGGRLRQKHIRLYNWGPLFVCSNDLYQKLMLNYNFMQFKGTQSSYSKLIATTWLYLQEPYPPGSTSLKFRPGGLKPPPPLPPWFLRQCIVFL